MSTVRLFIGHGIDTTRVPRMTATQSTYGQNQATPTAKTLEGGHCVRRTTGIETAMLSDPGAENVLVCADHQDEDGTHGCRLSRFQCCSSSVRSAAAVLAAAVLRARMTISQLPRSRCWQRKLSRIIRLIRFRSTARAAALRETAKPRRGCSKPLGTTKTVKARLVLRVALANTCLYSAGRVRRSVRTKLAWPRCKTRSRR